MVYDWFYLSFFQIWDRAAQNGVHHYGSNSPFWAHLHPYYNALVIELRRAKKNDILLTESCILGRLESGRLVRE